MNGALSADSADLRVEGQVFLGILEFLRWMGLGSYFPLYPIYDNYLVFIVCYL